MRSLTFKLVLAFLLTSVAGVALASIFIRQSITREFDSYVIAQQRTSFVTNVSVFYETNGSWDGIDRWLRTRVTNQSPVQAPAPTASLPALPRIRFGLVDTAGVVVLPFNGYQVGAQVEQAVLAQGVPVTVDGRNVGTVITPDFTNFRNVAEDRYLARTDNALSIAALVMVGVALLLGVLLARVITRPARELTAAARRIAGGDLQQRVPVRSRDELGVLAAQFNQMSADLAHATQLRRQMTADVAHDLRTPLTVIAGYLEALRDQVLRPTPERFATMYDETRLLLHLVDDLHTLSLADANELSLQRRTIAPPQLLERVVETYRHTAEQQGIALRVQTSNPLPDVCVDVEQMTRALNNLVSNALRYTPEGGVITLAATVVEQDKETRRQGVMADTDLLVSLPPGLPILHRASFVRFTVRDTGVGIAADHLPNVFERFYRADPARQQETGGSGLGLAIVKSIVEAHGGEVGVESVPGQGTTFSITLPLGEMSEASLLEHTDVEQAPLLGPPVPQ